MRCYCFVWRRNVIGCVRSAFRKRIKKAAATLTRRDRLLDFAGSLLVAGVGIVIASRFYGDVKSEIAGSHDFLFDLLGDLGIFFQE